MYRAGMASIFFSWRAKAGFCRDFCPWIPPKTKVLADKLLAMNLNSVLVIADVVDENLYLASQPREHPRG
jgi:large subunit ribosomal protein L4